MLLYFFLQKYIGNKLVFDSLRFSFVLFFDMGVPVLASMILGNPNGAGLSRSIVQRGSFHGFGFGGEHASSNQNSAFFWFPNPRFVDLPVVDVDVKTTTSWGPEEEERAAPVSSEKPRDAADASSWGISERNPGCGCQVNTTRSPKALFNWCIKLWIVVTKLGCFTISIHSILEFSGSGSRCLAWLRGVLHHNKLTSLKLLKRCGVSGSW